jgi:hypothetical protein
MLFGSTSVIETPLGNVIALVDVFTENKVRSSEPSNNFMAIVFVAELSSQIVPATADAGLDPPRWPVFKAVRLLLSVCLNVAKV